MSGYSFRLATENDRTAIVGFINTHWEIRHALVNLPDFFDYYYTGLQGKLNFALAEAEGRIVAAAGFVCAGITPPVDIWVSLWVADASARGSGLELMAALPGLTGCRTMACNNIRPETRPFYEFLGYTTGRFNHFYRLAPRQNYQLAVVASPVILPVQGQGTLVLLPDTQALEQSGFIPPENANPAKDGWYIQRRYYHYPRQKYTVYGCYGIGGTSPAALLVTRTVPVPEAQTAVLRIVDFIGEPETLPEFGTAIQGLMQAESAEYAECYCAGIPPEVFSRTGFTQRLPEDGTIIPNYLTPPVQQNTEYYYFTSNAQGFRMFRADGDQDRPNITVP